MKGPAPSLREVMGMPVVLLPLKTEFGWDLGDISGALELRLALFGLFGPAYYQTMSVRPLLAEALEGRRWPKQSGISISYHRLHTCSSRGFLNCRRICALL